MLFQHLIYSAKEHPWRLVGFIVFLIGLVVLVWYVTAREYRSAEDASTTHIHSIMGVTSQQSRSESRPALKCSA
jgi:hypothetical protein